MGKGGRDTNLEVEIRFAVVGSIGKRKKKSTLSFRLCFCLGEMMGVESQRVR